MSRKRDNNSRLVYSTEKGDMCKKCQEPGNDCRCPQGSAASVGDGIVRVGRETKGRKGKGVSLQPGCGPSTTEFFCEFSRTRSQFAAVFDRFRVGRTNAGRAVMTGGGHGVARYDHAVD